VALNDCLGDVTVMRRLMYELSTTDVDKALVMQPFKNKARTKQRIFTLPPNADFALNMLKSGEIALRVLDDRREVLSSFYHQDWTNNQGFIPSKLTRTLIDQEVKTGKYQEVAYSAKDKRVTISEMARLMGCKETDHPGRKRLEITTGYVNHRGVLIQENFYVIPKLHESRKIFCENMGLDYMDLFGDEIEDNKVVPLRPAKPEDTPF
jgi:hypothetical protein